MADALPERLPPAWILAGGLGTRLREVLPDRAKALAPIGSRPFLALLLDQLRAAGFEDVVMLLGARHEGVVEFIAAQSPARADEPPPLRIRVSIESSPLGTGGAVKNAEALATEPFFLLNGDTYVDFDARAMWRQHRDSGALATLAVVQRDDCRRFGRVDFTPEGFLAGFREKTDAAEPGWINAGVYLLQPEVVSLIPADRPVSLEREVFPTLLASGRRVAVSRQAGTFFDIGTPDDLRAFQEYAQLKHHD